MLKNIPANWRQLVYYVAAALVLVAVGAHWLTTDQVSQALELASKAVTVFASVLALSNISE